MESHNPISECRAQLAYALSQIAHVFSHVPDERLFWRPSETAKSALEIVAHVTLVLQGQSALVSGLTGATPPLREMLDVLATREKEFTNRDGLLAAFHETRDDVLRILSELPNSRLDSTVEFFGRATPVSTLLRIMVTHIWMHCGQLEYLQTIWGDREARFA